MGLFDGFESGKEKELNAKLVDSSEIIRRLSEDLMEMKEKYQQLEETHRIAIGARKAAVEKIRDLQDVLRLKEGIFEDFERQVSNSEARGQRLETELAACQRELSAIRAEREEFPLSDLDLLHRHQTQTDVFEQIQEALTCPVCYETYSKNSVVSLQCGHSFCESCFSSWEEKHLAAFKISPVSGPYLGADCPECRSTDVRRGRVRIWAMEEIVRLVERGIRESKKLYTPPPVPSAPTIASASPLPSTTTGPPSPSASLGPDISTQPIAVVTILEEERSQPEEGAEVGVTPSIPPRSESSPPMSTVDPHLPAEVEMHDDLPDGIVEEQEVVEEERRENREEEPMDEDAASILRPRPRLPYPGVDPNARRS